MNQDLKERGTVPEYMTERETSNITKFGVQTLRNHRHERRGIPYCKLPGGSIRYRLEDVLIFMESRRIEPEGGK